MFCMLEIAENMKIAISNFMVLLWANEHFQNKHTSLICFTNLTILLLAWFCTLEIEENVKIVVSYFMAL